MNIVKNIKNFLYDKNYFINVYEDKIHIFNYLDLLVLTDNQVILKVDKFILEIMGKKLHVIKMLDKEILIKGIIFDMRFIYE